jgi:hypothetical protein
VCVVRPLVMGVGVVEEAGGAGVVGVVRRLNGGRVVVGRVVMSFISVACSC